MRYTLALFVMLAGCSPVVAPSDAPAPHDGPSWAFCEHCEIDCSAPSAPACVPLSGRPASDCAGCAPLCLDTGEALPSPSACAMAGGSFACADALCLRSLR